MTILMTSIIVIFPALPYQNKLFGSMWLMMIFYSKEKISLW
jgi:hypothetical protein